MRERRIIDEFGQFAASGKERNITLCVKKYANRWMGRALRRHLEGWPGMFPLSPAQEAARHLHLLEKSARVAGADAEGRLISKLRARMRARELSRVSRRQSRAGSEGAGLRGGRDERTSGRVSRLSRRDSAWDDAASVRGGPIRRPRGDSQLGRAVLPDLDGSTRRVAPGPAPPPERPRPSAVRFESAGPAFSPEENPAPPPPHGGGLAPEFRPAPPSEAGTAHTTAGLLRASGRASERRGSEAGSMGGGRRSARKSSIFGGRDLNDDF